MKAVGAQLITAWPFGPVQSHHLAGQAFAIWIEAGHNAAVTPKAVTSAPAGSTFDSRVSICSTCPACRKAQTKPIAR
jgi:hypothetical protein